jgi:penicillin-binding protein A
VDRQIRRLAIGFLVLFALLAVNVNYLQVVAADRLANHPANKRLLFEECEIDRGDIVAADRQTTLAEDQPADTLGFQRRYPPEPSLGYGHLVGYYSCLFSRTALEQSFNEYLTGRADELFPQRLVDEILGREEKGANVVLSIEPELQQLAAHFAALERPPPGV